MKDLMSDDYVEKLCNKDRLKRREKMREKLFF